MKQELLVLVSICPTFDDMRYCILLVLFILFSNNAFCQVTLLKPTITNGSLPAANEPIAPVESKNYFGDFSKTGYTTGDTIPDFTLYTTDGKPVNIKSVLEKHQPVLLICGSYTCPNTRKNINLVNEITSFYAGRVAVYVIYIVEAHPDGAVCPYMPFDMTCPENDDDGIKYKQPVTYGGRVQNARAMKVNMAVVPQVLIDGPANEWWRHFGPAANNAYLVNTDGIIVAKNNWFNSSVHESIWCSIDKLIGTNSGHCSAIPHTGN